MDYQGVYNPLFEALKPEPTDLLNATTVALINRNLGKPISPDQLDALPGTTIIRAVDFNSLPLKDTELSFFDVTSGKASEIPFFTGTTGASGTLLVPSRPSNDGQPTIFGEVNDLRKQVLVRARLNGETESAYLPAWQLFDMASRGNKAAAVFDLFFCLPGAPLDSSIDLAKNRIITDSTGQAPEKLATLANSTPGTTATLGMKAGDWVEIDLGRDRPAGEVRLISTGPDFWKRFDIVVYSTGQTAKDAAIWARETDFPYSYLARSSDDGNGERSLSYRGLPQRFRYVRIINRADSDVAKLAEIKVTPVKITDSGGG
jgi:hypothetical protein